MEIKKKKKK